MKKRCHDHLIAIGEEMGRPLTFDYRFEHTRTVATFALRLAPELGVHPPLAEIAAWLHDIAKCWDPALKKEVNIQRREEHGLLGGQEAEEYLLGLGLPGEEAYQVRKAIAAHVGYVKDYTITDPLSALIWDADKLSKIGIAGTLHFLAKNLSYGGDLIDLKDYFAAEEIPLHIAISSSLNTEHARRMAAEELREAAAFRRQVSAALKS